MTTAQMVRSLAQIPIPLAFRKIGNVTDFAIVPPVMMSEIVKTVNLNVILECVFLGQAGVMVNLNVKTEKTKKTVQNVALKSSCVLIENV